jgi:hypothetical protein
MEEVNQSGEELEAAAPANETYSDANAGEQEKQVPLSALQAERAERQRMQEEMKYIKDHMSLLQANQSRPQAPKEEELSDDDILTVGEAKKYISRIDNNYRASLEELKMASKHPDYREVIENYLPEVLKANPSLRSRLQENSDYELAYHLAKTSDSYRNSKREEKKSSVATKILDNASKPGNLSSTGSSTPVGMVKSYSNMSDGEFRALMNKNMGLG